MLRALFGAASAAVAAVALLSSPAALHAVTFDEADINVDGSVNSIDLGIVGAGADPRADVNRDGAINSVDLGLVATFYATNVGAYPPVATPTTVSGRTTFVTTGDVPADFSLRAYPGAQGDIRVEFVVDEALFAIEDASPYSLFGDDGYTLNRGSLPAGSHEVVAYVYPQSGDGVLDHGSVTLGEPSAPAPTSTSTPAPSPSPAAPTSTPSLTATTAPTSTATRTPTATATAPGVTPTPTNTASAIPTATVGALPGTRDKLLWPFASTSIWNMPIGSNAAYVAANIDFSGWAAENAMPIMAPAAPLRTLFHNSSWWPGTACNATGATQQVPVPDGYIVPAPPSLGDGTLPNRPGGVLLADGTTIQEFQYATRCSATGPLIAGSVRCKHSIYGSGMCGFGAQGGSGLSGVGGVLRLWEVNGTDAIRHALKVTVSAQWLSNCNGGYRWPAVAADGYHNDAYRGQNCDLRMGSLLALPPAFACPSGTSLTARICQAMKDYGLYVGDTHNAPGWNPLSIIGEIGTASSLTGISGQLVPLAEALQVVTNNSSSNVGGGGTPRAPLAPPIGN